MKRALVTGSSGFMGKNLIEKLKRLENVKILRFEEQDGPVDLRSHLKKADIVFHLAGVNRPKNEEAFETGNAGLTRKIVDMLMQMNRSVPIVLSSSIQAMFDNPYGRSKKGAEDALFQYAGKSGTSVYVYRFPNVFGKWCRPNYNSVVATFCHNIARDLPIVISDETRDLELIYIDDLVAELAGLTQGNEPAVKDGFCAAGPTYKTTLGRLASTIMSFRESRKTLTAPDFSDSFVACLYATYLSYLPETGFAYTVGQHEDERGKLAELLKSPHFGQIFVSRTRPGIVRGNHYHDTKVEKFMVLEGEALIRFRHILEEKVLEYPVSGEDFKVVDIPPGYAHSIENTGKRDLIVLFWSNEVFDVQRPDTYWETV